MGSDYREQILAYKYAQIPEEPKHRKKKSKRKTKRSDHKHIYKPCYYKYGHLPYLVSGTYCSICGRHGGNTNWFDTPVKEADPELPIFEVSF